MSDIDVARGLSLTAFLERQLGVKGHKSGISMRFSYCPACGENGHSPHKLHIQADDNHWFCHRCGERGSLIDAAMSLWGCDFKTALEKLVAGQSGAVKRIPIDQAKIDEAKQKRNEKLKEALGIIHPLTKQFQDDFNCLKYLTDVRKLPIEVIREAQNRNMLGFLPSDSRKAERLLLSEVGENLLHESGMWTVGKKRPMICYRPLVFFLPGFTSAEFRIIGEPKSKEQPKSIRLGTDSKYPYVWRSKSGSKAAVVEGFIDTLSTVALGFKGHVIGLPGCRNWNPEWFVNIHDKLQVSEYIRVFDNDTSSEKNWGQLGSEKLKVILDEFGYPNSAKNLPPDKDMNKILIEKQAA